MAPESTPASLEEGLEMPVARAKSGDREALETVVRAVQRDVHRLALRFLCHPQDAEDATQEILVRIITALGNFRGESSFRTWVYRVACNSLLSIEKKRMERQALSFEEFAEDLSQGLSEQGWDPVPGVERSLLLEEVKVGCTLAMLLCLDRPHRLAYILGEILELDHQEAAAVLEISAATYRKRLSRARAGITRLMTERCGLANPSNACRCERRVTTAMKLGRLDPGRLLFACSAAQAKSVSGGVAQDPPAGRDTAGGRALSLASRPADTGCFCHLVTAATGGGCREAAYPG